MANKAVRIGILSGVLASACCIGPIVLGILGLGSLGLGSLFGTYHWYFQGGAAVGLGLAWVIFLKEKKRRCAQSCNADTDRVTKGIIVAVSLVVAVFIGLNVYASVLANLFQ